MTPDPSILRAQAAAAGATIPDGLRFVIGAACGIALGIVAQVLLSLAGLNMSAVWRDLFTTPEDERQAALAWWVIAGAAFVGSYAGARAAPLMLSQGWGLRWLRWLAAAAALATLAVAGHFAAAPGGVAAKGRFLADLIAFALATTMALAGGFLAMRR